MSRLPIEDVIDALARQMTGGGVCVLQAPPGAGKTTRVPLALLEAGAFSGRLIMLEPRRLAARAAAERMAQVLGERVGETVGYRMRGESKTSKATRIEVVTEGVLTRMVQADPELPGVGCVVFDEFHERSLNGDLGLALVWETRGALREDLKVLVMSATLDAAPVAALLGGAPVVTSEGRSFPVETRWLDTPRRAGARLDADMAALIALAVAETEGGVLAFLPGAREIERVAGALSLPAGVVVRPLYGALPFAAQRAAIAPAEGGARKVVLATSIAETSLTIEDVRVVVDAGLARRARYDAGSGMSRLVTERASKAEATQRQGRAGRVAEGVCYRLWTKAEEGVMGAFAPPEIETADLAGLALDLAAWGAEPADLSFLSMPPEGAFAAARRVLAMLGALDAQGRITEHGRALARVPLHPRLAHMLALSGAEAASVAAVLAARPGAARTLDLAARMRDAQSREVKAEAKRLARFAKGERRSLGEMVALGYPDRVALRRKGADARYHLSGGKGAVVPAEDALASQRLLAVADLDGDAREARVRAAAVVSEAELRGLFAGQIVWRDVCAWSRREARVLTRKQEMLGALVLDDRIWQDPDPDAVARALLEGVRDLGLGALNWSRPASLLRARGRFLGDAVDWSDAGLLASLEDWLLPYLAGKKTAADLKSVNLAEALRNSLSWEALQDMDRLAPAAITTPLGRKAQVDYAGDVPGIEVRLQEMFGCTVHPTVGPDRLPVKITLLSPGQKPVQVTQDLPGFWTNSYADVRKDMRGRYPRHPWPEDPTQAEPTVRAKPRGT
ncbi:ATP-dependent helicase HrpB [uncultured Litoreibacter sp.]|uniref:ATP-dependent helicase HrpB n=1 Tax=uncultured Litoreibacter sp. TaxID=1392394 RepID=UPI00261EC6C7|nr:ATP-dependent helicase HrpB [uncultured Litoreibacter sp.]